MKAVTSKLKEKGEEMLGDKIILIGTDKRHLNCIFRLLLEFLWGKKAN